MKTTKKKEISPLLQEMAGRLVRLGLGEVVYAPDGHVFFNPCVAIQEIWGALDAKKAGAQAGERVVIRRVRKRAKNSKYAGMPMFQLYTLKIVQKDFATMPEDERLNIELNTRALRMAHAVERDPVREAYYRRLHAAHLLNPKGYNKRYENFFGFLVALFCKRLATQQAKLRKQSAAGSICLVRPTATGIRLCVPSTYRPARSGSTHLFRPFARLPMVA